MIEVSVYDAKPYDRRYLIAAGEQRGIHWRFHEFRLGPETALAARGAHVACIFVNDRADAPTLEILKGQGVQCMALRCAGYNNLDVAAAKALGLRVSRVPAYSPYAVAEHAVALLLALNRRIHRAFNRVREMNFSLGGLVGFDLHGKTAGIIGAGKIGRLTAQILRGFGMRVLAYDPYPDRDWSALHGVELCDLNAVISGSDVLSLHVPLTPETRHLICRESLDAMRPGAFLINVSRGKLIDTRAMIQSLKSGRLGGVALDVYEEEEGIFFEDLSGQVLQDDELARLLTFPNVLITAHQAFLTCEALQEIARVTVDNILRSSRAEAALEGTLLC